MNRNFLLRLSFTVCFFAPALFASTINVPADQPTIQSAINAASNGDTVVVAPGTYTENINFLGKAITVESSKGAKVTTINGGGVSSVVTFSSHETLASVLKGFTLTNGSATITADYQGGGIAIDVASPTIEDNIIEDNLAEDAGGGIGINSGSPLIQGNTIRNNGQTIADFGVGGGGISVSGKGSAQIIGNLIQNNSWNSSGAGFGGGISLNGSVSTLIEGLYLNSTLALLANNTITDGRHVPYTSRYVVLIYPDASIVIANNIIFASSSATDALGCGNSITVPANFYNNDVFSSNANGEAYLGCSVQTGTNGNISAAPDFVGTSNFRLKGGSPAIDAGSNAAPHLLKTDLSGDPRIINGNGGPTAIVDIGAYEFVPVVFSPKSLSFGAQAIGSSTHKTLKLTNAQDKVLNISSFSTPTNYSVSGCGTSVAAFASCTLTVTFQPLTAGTFKRNLTVIDDAGSSPQTVPLSGIGR
jgi:hypothetical protein